MWPGRKQTNAAPTLPPVILTGPRVYIRPPAPFDATAWAAVRAINEPSLRLLEPTWPEDCLSEDFFARRLRRQARDWHDDTAYSFLIFLPGGDLIGGINLNHVARGAAQSASIGYWLNAAHQGQGYMREALGLAIDYALETLALHRINAACLPGNAKSIALLKALGFEEEGFAKAYYRINGVWEDHALFGLTRTGSDPTTKEPEPA